MVAECQRSKAKPVSKAHGSESQSGKMAPRKPVDQNKNFGTSFLLKLSCHYYFLKHITLKRLFS